MCPEWLHPGNSAQAEFWNGPIGHGWVDRQEIQDAILGPVDDSLFASASLQPGEAVIDVGCGCGATTIEFARRVGPKGEVLGLDISAPMLERARHRAPADLPLRFALADATIYEFAPPTSSSRASASCSLPIRSSPFQTCGGRCGETAASRLSVGAKPSSTPG